MKRKKSVIEQCENTADWTNLYNGRGHPCYEGPEMLFLLLPIYADYLTGLIIKLNEYS
uniref:Uncharacterized protein n=1 Tax=Anguilla anguilla TaxID=7936 RepID=A0A0E9XUH7_ANGAN